MNQEGRREGGRVTTEDGEIIFIRVTNGMIFFLTSVFIQDDFR